MTQTIINVPAAGAFDPADITLTDDTSGALLIKEGSNEYMRINTTNGSELTNITAGSAQGIYISGNSRTNVLTGTTDANSDFRIINSGGVQIFRVQGNHDTRFRAQNFYITDKATDTPYLQTDTNTNFTYTLDGASGAVFKVVDDNATPKTYLSITESTQSFGADPYVHKVTLGDNNGYFNLGPNVLRANAMSGGSTALYGPASYLYGQSAVSVTTSQTYSDFDPCQTPYTMTMASGATGDVTINSGFAVRGDYQTGAGAKQSYPVLWVFQNDNATHDFILSFDGGTTGLEHTKTGDTDAAALISAAGLTLTPGQRYIVRFQKITNELLLIESVDKH